MSHIKSKNLIFILTTILSCIFIFVGYKICSIDLSGNDNAPTVKSKIVEIISEKENNSATDNDQSQSSTVLFSAEILSGKDKGKSVRGIQSIDETLKMSQPKIKVGDKVLLQENKESSDPKPGDFINVKYIFVSYYRFTPLYFLIAGFFILILILGRMKGLKTIISLSITCMSVFVIYIPGTLKGYNVYLLTLIVGAFIIISSLILINGVNKKSISAILGNFLGVTVSALLCLLMHNVLKLTGFLDENYIYLQMLNPDKPINLLAVAWGGTVIGSLGAIMDISMTISSSIHELSTHMEEKTYSKLFHSGMNIGRDAIGTMTNTLILAYIGSSFALVLLLFANNRDLQYIMNSEMITAEISQSLVGSIGILVAVPITAVISAKLAIDKR